MSVSVIIGVYNRVGLIGRALDSVFAQTLPAQEIIVIDDGSTDGTGEHVAANYPRVTLVRQANRGLSAARNAGIARAAGKYIAFLDSDDAWLPQKLEVQTRVFADRPDLGLLATQKYKNRQNYPTPPIGRVRLRYFPWKAFFKRTWLHPSSAMVPRRVLEAVGGFDEMLHAAEDWDMWLRIAYRYPVARIEQPLTAVYIEADSMSRDRRKQYRNDIEVMVKWAATNPRCCDVEGRLGEWFLQYRLLIFALMRGTRLKRFGGRDAVREFIQRFEERIVLSGAARAVLHPAKKILGW